MTVDRFSMTNILEIKRERLFAAMTREGSDASLARPKIRSLQDGRRFEMFGLMAQPLLAMRGSL
jgi:hypothetical protein